MLQRHAVYAHNFLRLRLAANYACCGKSSVPLAKQLPLLCTPNSRFIASQTASASVAPVTAH